MRRYVVLVAGLCALALGAGSFVTAQDATPGATPGATPMASPAASPVAGTAVEIRNFAYNPPTIQVPVGGTISWTNQDQVPHTATADDGSFNTNPLTNGQSASHTFAAAGSFPYVCLFHPYMKGTVVVE